MFTFFKRENFEEKKNKRIRLGNIVDEKNLCLFFFSSNEKISNKVLKYLQTKTQNEKK